MDNNKYAEVYFGPDELSDYRHFLQAMNGIRIITISEQDIDNDISFLLATKSGAENRLVLHGDKEVTSFELIMKTFFQGKKYEITDDPNDRTFDEWLKKKKENAQNGVIS